MWTQQIDQDKHIFMLAELPLITIYDDNFFLRNDYDILSSGQRDYLINFFKQLGFEQTSGKLMQKQNINLHFPTPNRMLAISNFDESYLTPNGTDYYFVTPTTFAECLFHLMLNQDQQQVLLLFHQLIKKCPFNMEYLRDIHTISQIAKLTDIYCQQLMAYQKKVIAKKFKRKKSL